MRAMLAIAAKDLRLLARDRTSAFFVLAFPLAVAIFFGTVFGGGAGEASIRLAVLDSGGGPLSTALRGDLAARPQLMVLPVPDEATGEMMVRRGQASALLVIPTDFDERGRDLLRSGRLELDLRVDPARNAEAAMLVGTLHELGFRTMARAMGDASNARRMVEGGRTGVALSPGMSEDRRERLLALLAAVDDLARHGDLNSASPAATHGTGDGPAMLPLISVRTSEVRDRRAGPSNAYAITFPQGAAWGLMGCVVTFAAGLAEERRRGTMLRLATAPLPLPAVLLGKTAACFAASLGVILFLAVVARMAFGVRVSDWRLLVLAAAASAFAFSGLAMALASFFRTESSARSACNAVVLVLAMVGGGTVPLAFMPGFLRTLSAFSPFSWSILAVEGAVWRGMALEEVLPSILVLLALGLAGMVLGLARLRTGDPST
jgi:ABC-2 type transport system permease protein